MLPDWETIRGVWPLLVGIAGLWARLEVALSRAREQSKQNEREITKLERKVEDQAVATQAQAVQLGRIEEAIVGIGRTLDRLDRKIPGG
jgi:hypothetical protein